MRSQIYKLYKETENQSFETDAHFLKKMNFEKSFSFYEEISLPIKNHEEKISLNVLKSISIFNLNNILYPR